jgi:hypothetical protein
MSIKQLTIKNSRYELRIAVLTKMSLFWNMTSCRLVNAISVSEEFSASIFTVCGKPENVSRKVMRNVGTYLRIYKTEIFKKQLAL